MATKTTDVTVIVKDNRMQSPSSNRIKVTYDPGKVEKFDTRIDSEYSRYAASWGLRVVVPEGVLYIDACGYEVECVWSEKMVLYDD